MACGCAARPITRSYNFRIMETQLSFGAPKDCCGTPRLRDRCVCTPIHGASTLSRRSPTVARPGPRIGLAVLMKAGGIPDQHCNREQSVGRDTDLKGLRHEAEILDRSPDTLPLLLDHHLASFDRIHPSPKCEKILVEHWARGIEIDIRDIAAPGIEPSLNGCMIGIVAHGFLHIRLLFRCTIGVSRFWEGATSLSKSRRKTGHVQDALTQRRETAVARIDQ